MNQMRKYAFIETVPDDLCEWITVSSCCKIGPIVDQKFCSYCGSEFVMMIYEICIDQQGMDTYNSHVIIANTEQEVVKLAKSIAADEGELAWDKAIINNVGIYQGTEVNPFILQSSFNAG